ncbi:MAG: ATP-binding protein [Actinomycetes bacterium]
MPLSQKPLDLPHDPLAVRQARAWVGQLLTSLGRVDLVNSAQLGVSELVTNAVLHAAPPLTVSLRGTREHPRIEVHDGSDQPPAASGRMGEDRSLLTTYGRGLGIVSWYSSRWGADLTGEGKTVWFEPVAEPDPEHEVAGDLVDLDRDVEREPGEPVDEATLRPVRLLNLPVRLFVDFRGRYRELSRELRLLALTHGADYPVAHELTEVARRVERERRLARGTEVLEQAILEGTEYVDLDYRVAPEAPRTMHRLLELLEEADVFCRQERMLALAATPEQAELQRWYLGEFVRQGAGEAPRAWVGQPVGTALTTDAR